MPSRLVLIHTVPPLVEVFARLAGEMLPDVTLLHVLDEPLLEHVKQAGGIGDTDVARLAAHVEEAALVGAEAVLVTCSTVSPAVDGVRATAPIPVLKIDEAMVAEAVRKGNIIGVVATNRTTLEPTRHLLESEAARHGRPIAVDMRFVESALPALLAGDGATHDRLVAAAVADLAPQVDVVVLAQASMARALALIPPTGSTPVLASPPLALAAVVALLAEQAREAAKEQA